MKHLTYDLKKKFDQACEIAPKTGPDFNRILFIIMECDARFYTSRPYDTYSCISSISKSFGPDDLPEVSPPLPNVCVAKQICCAIPSKFVTSKYSDAPYNNAFLVTWLKARLTVVLLERWWICRWRLEQLLIFYHLSLDTTNPILNEPLLKYFAFSGYNIPRFPHNIAVLYKFCRLLRSTSCTLLLVNAVQVRLPVTVGTYALPHLQLFFYFVIRSLLCDSSSFRHKYLPCCKQLQVTSGPQMNNIRCLKN